MSRIDAVLAGPAIRGGRTKPASAQGSGFDVIDDPQLAERLEESQATGPVGLAGMLALQEAEAEIAGNRNARRHGLAVLEALQALQHGLLGVTGAGGEDIAALTRLAGRNVAVADPGMADVLSAIRLRAKIELLRRGVETV